MKTRQAFTLIELLIVITIIGIIAAMAVSSYGVTRKQATLDIAADSLVSSLKEANGKVKAGRNAFDTASSDSVDTQATKFSCFGLRFQDSAPFIQNVAMPYISADNLGRADVCDGTQAVLTPYGLTENIAIQDITVDMKTLSSKNMDIVFKPPFAKAVISTDKNSFSTFSKMNFSIGYEGSDQIRTLEFDNVTGNIHRIQNVNPLP